MRARTLALSAALTLVALPGWATTAVKLTDAAMVAQSAAIVTGRCVSVESRWVDRDLVTVATVEVADRLKGSVGETISVVLPGGADARARVPVAMTYPGAPVLIPGEETFLFLAEYGALPASYAVVGFSQGKFSIVEEADGVRRVTRNLALLRLRAGARTTSGGERSESLEVFSGHIRDLVAAGEVER